MIKSGNEEEFNRYEGVEEKAGIKKPKKKHGMSLGGKHPMEHIAAARTAQHIHHHIHQGPEHHIHTHHEGGGSPMGGHDGFMGGMPHPTSGFGVPFGNRT